MLAERAQAWISQMDGHERRDYCASMLELSIELAFGHPLDEANRTRLSEVSEQQILTWSDRLSTADTLVAFFDEEVEPSHGRYADRLVLKNSQTPEKIHRMIMMLIQEGMEKGRDEGEIHVLVGQLETRFGLLDSSIKARLAAADATQRWRWAERVLDADLLEAIFQDDNDPSSEA